MRCLFQVCIFGHPVFLLLVLLEGVGRAFLLRSQQTFELNGQKNVWWPMWLGSSVEGCWLLDASPRRPRPLVVCARARRRRGQQSKTRAAQHDQAASSPRPAALIDGSFIEGRRRRPAGRVRWIDRSIDGNRFSAPQPESITTKRKNMHLRRGRRPPPFLKSRVPARDHPKGWPPQPKCLIRAGPWFSQGSMGRASPLPLRVHTTHTMEAGLTTADRLRPSFAAVGGPAQARHSFRQRRPQQAHRHQGTHSNPLRNPH